MGVKKNAKDNGRNPRMVYQIEFFKISFAKKNGL